MKFKGEGKELEKLLGQVNPHTYNQEVIKRKTDIPEADIKRMTPEKSNEVMRNLDGKLIQEDIELCYELVRDSQPWADPTRPKFMLPKLLTDELDLMLSNYDPNLTDRLEYFTAIKPEVEKDKNTKDSFYLNHTHLDLNGIDAFFEVILSEKGDNNEERYIRLPFDITTFPKDIKEKEARGIYVMKVDDEEFDLDLGYVKMGQNTSKEFVKKHLKNHLTNLMSEFKKRYNLGQILTR